MIAIKFREDFDQYQRGDVASLEPTLMQRLVAAGKAVPHLPESARVRVEKPKAVKPKKPQSRTKKAEKAVKIKR